MVEDESIGGFLKLTKTLEWVSGDTIVAPVNKKLTAKVCYYAVTCQSCDFFFYKFSIPYWHYREVLRISRHLRDC